MRPEPGAGVIRYENRRRDQTGSRARLAAARRRPRASGFEEDDLTFEINEPDAYALEEGLQLKEKHGGEVVVLCAGPGARRADHSRSAGQGRRPRDSHRRGGSGRVTIRWRPRGCWPRRSQPEKPDLILTGLQSDDLGYGQTGVILAELLGLPHATIIMQVEKQDGGIRVKRELEDGWFQHVEMPLPALLTIQSGINKLRYATLMGIKKAKTKEIKRVTAGRAGRRGRGVQHHAGPRVPAGAHQADADLRGRSEGSRGASWWRN